jgi:hypothetical protein
MAPFWEYESMVLNPAQALDLGGSENPSFVNSPVSPKA